VRQSLQDVWTTLGGATLIRYVNDKDESPFWEATKFADEVKEEWCSIVSGTMLGSLGRRSATMFRKGEEYCELVDKSRKDISGLAQIWVIPPAEKRSSNLLLIVNVCVVRMC
jgi:hypothetical protein